MTKEYTCKECDYTTTRKANYERHLKSNRHLKIVKPAKLYKCEQCNYQTKDCSNWRRHKNSSKHKKGKEKPTATRCDLCEKDFASAQVCQVHMYRHYDKKQLLGDIFRMKGKLKRMQKYCHKRPSVPTTATRKTTLQRKQGYVTRVNE